MIEVGLFGSLFPLDGSGRGANLKMVRLVGFEPTTSAFAGPRSIQTELQAQKISGAEGEI